MTRRTTPARRTLILGGGFLIGGLAVAILLALVVSGFASSAPDGLERVAEDTGFLDTATDHAFSASPLADYAIRGVGNERLSTGLAGVLGVLLTFAAGAGLAALVRRRQRVDQDTSGQARPDGRRAGPSPADGQG